MSFGGNQTGRAYSSGVLIGNWSEDQAVRDDKMRVFKSTTQTGPPSLDGTATLSKSFNPQVASISLTRKVTLAPVAKDRALRFGMPLMLRSEATNTFLALDTNPRYSPKLNHFSVSGTPEEAPQVRSTWILRKVKDANNNFYESEAEAEIVHYGQYVRLVNEYASDSGFLSLTSSLKSSAAQTSGSKRQSVTCCLGGTNDQLFMIEQSDGKAVTCPLEGHPVRVGERIVLRHKPTNMPLVCQPEYRIPTTLGAEVEMAAHLVKLNSTFMTEVTQVANFFSFIAAPPGSKYVPFNKSAQVSALDRVKAKILARGSGGFASLRRTFRIFDDNNDKVISRREFKEGIELYGTPLSTLELDVVFKAFDSDGNGGITLTEFLTELRGAMVPQRRDLVVEAFKLIDTDGSGVASLAELTAIYGANLHRHPQVLDGSRTKEEVMREFISSWDRNRDGSVTVAEFIEYYSEVSASIDNDNYFELMIRNAWHIAGGEGEAANTANRRVLVVYNDNRQEVVTLLKDLGVGTDIPSIRAALEKQGVRNIKRVEKAM